MVSYLFRRDSRAEAYRTYPNGELLLISFMTVAAFDRWALERDWGEARIEQMEKHMRSFVVYPYTANSVASG